MLPMRLDLRIAGAIVIDQLNRHCTSSLLQQAKIVPPPGHMSPSDAQRHACTFPLAPQPCALPAAAPGAAALAGPDFAAGVQSSDQSQGTLGPSLLPLDVAFSILPTGLAASACPVPEAGPNQCSQPQAQVRDVPARPLGGLGTSPAWLGKHSDVASLLSPQALSFGPQSIDWQGSIAVEGLSGMQTADSPALVMLPAAGSELSLPAAVSVAGHEAPDMSCQGVPADVWNAQLQAVCSQSLSPANSGIMPLLEEVLSWQTRRHL